MQISTITCSIKMESPSSAVEITGKECKIEMTTDEASNIYNSHDRLVELLVRAVNNRTRERNYFRKYCELLEEEITEDSFDREIEEHEELYAINPNIPATREDVMLAMKISGKIMDVKSAEDLSDLFSFERESMIKSLPPIL